MMSDLVWRHCNKGLIAVEGYHGAVTCPLHTCYGDFVTLICTIGTSISFNDPITCNLSSSSASTPRCVCLQYRYVLSSHFHSRLFALCVTPTLPHTAGTSGVFVVLVLLMVSIAFHASTCVACDVYCCACMSICTKGWIS